MSVALEIRVKRVPSGFITEPNILDKPFQVVHAERTHKVGDAVQVTRLQHLFSNDLVKLENSGYLLMAHFTGKFFEFEGDTTIDISELAERASQELNINPNAVEHRTDIQLLFQDKRKYDYYPRAVSRCLSYPMAMITPVTNTVEISATTPEICISWEYSVNPKPELFEVQIQNIFDETLDTFSTENAELTLSFSQYEYDVGLYILKIYDSKNPEIDAPDIGIKVGNEHYFIPQTCNLNTAGKALEMAYYLETNRYYFDATEYYERASELSERPIFTELLNHFKNRK